MIKTFTRWWGRLDILHNNVGLSISGGDASDIEADAFASAEFGIHCNRIIDTLMATEDRVGLDGATREEIIEAGWPRPRYHKMGTVWDIAAPF